MSRWGLPAEVDAVIARALAEGAGVTIARHPGIGAPAFAVVFCGVPDDGAAARALYELRGVECAADGTRVWRSAEVAPAFERAS